LVKQIKYPQNQFDFEDELTMIETLTYHHLPVNRIIVCRNDFKELTMKQYNHLSKLANESNGLMLGSLFFDDARLRLSRGDEALKFDIDYYIQSMIIKGRLIQRNNEVLVSINSKYQLGQTITIIDIDNQLYYFTIVGKVSNQDNDTIYFSTDFVLNNNLNCETNVVSICFKDERFILDFVKQIDTQSYRIVYQALINQPSIFSIMELYIKMTSYGLLVIIGLIILRIRKVVELVVMNNRKKDLIVYQVMGIKRCKIITIVILEKILIALVAISINGVLLIKSPNVVSRYLILGGLMLLFTITKENFLNNSLRNNVSEIVLNKKDDEL
jgi:hypothetical protein